MQSYKVKRQFLRMEYLIISAIDEETALEQAQSDGYQDKFEPFWNQDEDWLYSVEEVTK